LINFSIQIIAISPLSNILLNNVFKYNIFIQEL